MSWTVWRHWLVLAFILTALNCLKPLHIDDTLYYLIATHVAAHPFDPYGFEILWQQWPEPGMEVLAPALLPYWLGAGMRVLGENVVALKAWLLPFNLLFVVSVHLLLRRFAHGVDVALLWMTVLSPAVLPGINLMLDIPALALSLASVNLAIAACDRRSLKFALLAGALGGLAIQTKYSALVAPGVVLAYGLVHRELRWTFIAAATAGAVFAAWELVLLAQYGRSHFLVQLLLAGARRSAEDRWALIVPLFTHPGGVAAGVSLLGLVALSKKAWLPTAYLVLLILSVSACWRSGLSLGVVFIALGACLWVIIGTVVWRLLRRDRPPSDAARLGLYFLLGWLFLEIVGYFVMSPFPAVRRHLGMLLVMTLLCGSLLRWRMAGPVNNAHLWLPVGLGIALGLGFATVDLREAMAGKRAVETAAREIRQRDPRSPIWFVGHWGFQHYAKRAGMQPVNPDHSRILPGQWLVVPLRGVHQQDVDLAPADFRLFQRFDVDDRVPFATNPGYYSGATPIDFRSEPRFSVAILRATTEVVPVSGATLDDLLAWPLGRSGKHALEAVPRLMQIAKTGNRDAAARAKAGIHSLGSPALRMVLKDPEPSLHDWAARALDDRRDDGER